MGLLSSALRVHPSDKVDEVAGELLVSEIRSLAKRTPANVGAAYCRFALMMASADERLALLAYARRKLPRVACLRSLLEDVMASPKFRQADHPSAGAAERTPTSSRSADENFAQGYNAAAKAPDEDPLDLDDDWFDSDDDEDYPSDLALAPSAKDGDPRPVTTVLLTMASALPPETVCSAVARADADVTHILVVDEGNIAGIVSRKVLDAAALVPDTRTLGDVMKSPVLCITEDTTIHEARLIMKQNNVGYLPVVAGDRLVGAVTREQLGLVKRSHTNHVS